MADNTTSKAPRTSNGWPLAAVLVTLIVAVAVPVTWLTVHTATAPERFLGGLSRSFSDAMRPKVSMKEIVLSSIADLHRENKLVVMTTDVNTDVTLDESASSWGIYWGTNTARVAVRDAKVQYVIDAGRMGTSDYRYDPDTHTLAITLPRPRVDTSMVAIDPAQIRTLDLRGGWALFDKDETRAHAVAELRPKIITQAAAPYVRELADARGIEAATKFLQPLADTLARDSVTLHIGYRED